MLNALSKLFFVYEKPEIELLTSRLAEPRRFMQVILGPRQVGKTTLVRQYLTKSTLPAHATAAAAVPSVNAAWIEQQWETARFRLRSSGADEGLLVLDEIQKLDNWAEVVKAQWDRDAFEGTPLKVVLLGSARLLLQQGLSESLAGRFEVIQLTHWTLAEMEAAFGFTPEQFVWFGGYPGTAALVADEDRWRDYVLHSLVETTLSKDILMLTRIAKPALLRRLFELGCQYSGQILSYTKLLGQLQDAGNTTTLAHYLRLLDSAGLLTGLDKFAADAARQRASVPKWQVQNAAFLTAYAPGTFAEVRARPDRWERHVETAVGVHLVRAARLGHVALSYWRDGADEVDFVLQRGGRVVGVEVKSGRLRGAAGIQAFKRAVQPDKVLLVGTGGIPYEEFLRADVRAFF